MRTKILILTFIGQVLLASVFPAYAITNSEKQRILQSFVRRQVLYDDSVSVDSVIVWSEQLLPTLKSGKDKEIYFLLQLQLANAYTLRGDVSLATDRAQLMYEEAQTTKYNFGMAAVSYTHLDVYKRQVLPSWLNFPGMNRAL